MVLIFIWWLPTPRFTTLLLPFNLFLFQLSRMRLTLIWWIITFSFSTMCSHFFITWIRLILGFRLTSRFFLLFNFFLDTILLIIKNWLLYNLSRSIDLVSFRFIHIDFDNLNVLKMLLAFMLIFFEVYHFHWLWFLYTEVMFWWRNPCHAISYIWELTYTNLFIFGSFVFDIGRIWIHQYVSPCKRRGLVFRFFSFKSIDGSRCRLMRRFICNYRILCCNLFCILINLQRIMHHLIKFIFHLHHLLH